MPPDSWCGYSANRRSGSGMLTERRMATAVSLASLRRILRCRRSDSVICLPMVITGFNELIGSWKTIAISAPQSSRISLSLRGIKSRPLNMTRPLRRTFVFGSRFMIDRAKIVLPEPDSPTTPEGRASLKERFTPSTARTRPRGVRKWVLRSTTSSNGPVVSPSALPSSAAVCTPKALTTRSLTIAQ